MASLPSLPPSIWEFPFEEGIVLARPDIQGFFILNPTAAILWNLLALSRSMDQLVDGYSQACDVSLELAKRDAAAAITEWETGLLRPVQSTRDALSLNPPSASCAPLAVAHYALSESVVEVRFFAEDLYAELAPRLESLRVDRQNLAKNIDVFWYGDLAVAAVDGRTLAADENLHAMRAMLLQELVRLDKPESDWLAVLHAGACNGQSGSILFPAKTCSGKTTLMAALMNAGIQVLSDDSAAVTRVSQRPVPMPYALMIREGSWAVLQRLFPQFDRNPIWEREEARVRYLPLSSQCSQEKPQPVRTLIFPEFKAVSTLQCQRLGQLDTLVRLRESGFWIEQRPEDFDHFLRWVLSLPAYALTYSSLDDAVHVIQRLLGNQPVATLPVLIPSEPDERF